MRLLYSSLKLLEVYHLKNLLEAEGIGCEIRNELLSRLAGEIPFTECAPQLWLHEERDYARACHIVDAFCRGGESGPAWRCPDCGEQLEGQFSACWQCGALRP